MIHMLKNFHASVVRKFKLLLDQTYCLDCISALFLVKPSEKTSLVLIIIKIQVGS